MKEKHVWKRVLVSVLAIILTIGLIPVLPAGITQAATLTSDEGFLYAVNADGKTVRILGYFEYPTEGYDENDEIIYTQLELNIPEKIDGKVVTAIGKEAFYEKKGVSKVTLPDTIERIEEYAFCRVGNLTINFPDSLEYIGACAFVGVCFMNSVQLPDSLTYMGEYAFYECRGAKTVEIGSGITEIKRRALDFYSAEEYVVAEDNPAFKSVDGVIFDKKMTEIVRYPIAKEGNYVIPDTVTVIGERAFEESLVEEVVIPETVTNIEAEAFYHSEISKVNIPAGLKKLSSTIFCGCYNLTQVEIPENVEEIGSWAFAGTSISSIVIPEKVTKIGESVFQGCDYLTEIEVKGNLVSVGYNVLEDTPWQKQQFVDSNFAILKDVLVATKGLSGDVIIPDSVRVISRIPFGLGSGNITSITLPASVKYIHNEGMGLSRSDWTKLNAIWVEDGNTEYVSDNGVLFDKNRTQVVDIPYKYSGKLTIPKTVKEFSWELPVYFKE